MLNTNKIEFAGLAAGREGFLQSDLPQVVFAGRSNVGKSSVINSLALRKNLARVGKTPGKTQHIIYFDCDGKLLWVDLPGYGYAKVSFSEKERWADLIETYFATCGTIELGILIVDARYAPTELDVDMLSYFKMRGTPVAIVANKADKLKKSECAAAVQRVAETLGVGTESVLLYSAEKKTGRDELFRLIAAFAKK